jgi:hypothetical protein
MICPVLEAAKRMPDRLAVQGLLCSAATRAARLSQVGAIVNPCHLSGHEQRPLMYLSPYFYTFIEPGNRIQGMNSASLCSLAGRYDNPIPPQFLSPIDCLKIPALTTSHEGKILHIFSWEWGLVNPLLYHCIYEYTHTVPAKHSPGIIGRNNYS